MNLLRNITKSVLKAESKTVTSLIKHPTNFWLQVQERFRGPVHFYSSSTLTTFKENEELDKLFRIVELEIRGNDPAVLKSYTWFATRAAEELGITVGECWAPRKAKHNRMTLLKSVHIYKKHRVQYEIRTYFRFMQFLRLTGSTADTFLEYIQRNLPEGVAMKVTKVQITSIPSHITPPGEQQNQQIQEHQPPTPSVLQATGSE